MRPSIEFKVPWCGCLCDDLMRVFEYSDEEMLAVFFKYA